MDDIFIKNALSYDLGADLHEAWRVPRKLENGTYESRLKKSNDENWNAIHGTDVVDIANCSFSELPSNWQFENLEAARVAIGLVYDNTIAGVVFTEEQIESMAAVIHEEWLKRNTWVFDKDYGNPELVVPYMQLSEEEKAKDRIQLSSAQAKVQAFVDGKIDINAICEQYCLPTGNKIL